VKTRLWDQPERSSTKKPVREMIRIDILWSTCQDDDKDTFDEDPAVGKFFDLHYEDPSCRRYELRGLLCCERPLGQACVD